MSSDDIKYANIMNLMDRIGNFITSTTSGAKQALDVNVVSGGQASESHIGEVGGNSKVVNPTITVDTAAYSIGDCVGGKLTLTDAMRVSGGTGILQSISVIDSSNIKPALDIIIFNADPTAATLTDNSAIAFSTDVSKISRRISIATTDYVTVAGVAIASINPSMIVQAVGSANLYACLNAVAAHDFVAATDLQVKFGFMRD